MESKENREIPLNAIYVTGKVKNVADTVIHKRESTKFRILLTNRGHFRNCIFGITGSVTKIPSVAKNDIHIPIS